MEPAGSAWEWEWEWLQGPSKRFLQLSPDPEAFSAIPGELKMVWSVVPCEGWQEQHTSPVQPKASGSTAPRNPQGDGRPRPAADRRGGRPRLGWAELPGIGDGECAEHRARHVKEGLQEARCGS